MCLVVTIELLLGLEPCAVYEELKGEMLGDLKIIITGRTFTCNHGLSSQWVNAPGNKACQLTQTCSKGPFVIAEIVYFEYTVPL